MIEPGRVHDDLKKEMGVAAVISLQKGMLRYRSEYQLLAETV